VQGAAVATLIRSKIKPRSVYIIDDQEAYSTGLADTVQTRLKAAGISVSRDSVSQQQSDFSSLIAKISRSTGLIYIPWQLPPRAQAFGRQLKQAGKGSIKIMGSDGLYDPSVSGLGSNVYDSMFPVNPKDKAVVSFKRSHSGNGDYFGAPSYVAAQVVVGAIDKACKNGTASRAEVRRFIAKTNIKKALLGFQVKFTPRGELTKGTFSLYKSNGKDFVPIP
jgi:branched-chain amino acid transport system substrate-binding protein